MGLPKPLEDLSNIITVWSDPNTSWIVIPIQRLILEILYKIFLALKTKIQDKTWLDEFKNNVRNVLQLLADQSHTYVYGKMIHEVALMILETFPEHTGKVIEAGKHQDLIDEKGLYYAMWRQQIGEGKK